MNLNPLMAVKIAAKFIIITKEHLKLRHMQ
jgi:hypothetical protein